MYEQYFHLNELPFSIVPNPRYLFLSGQHRDALAHLLYGIGVGGGFVVLTGEVGTGKTTLCRAILDQLPDDVEIALIFNPRLNSKELLASICDELKIAYPKPKVSLKQLIDALNHHLLAVHADGKRVIVLIDEAQNLRFDVLEQIRLLTNLETNQAKLIQIILVGQPELNQLLDRPDLRQLSQRVTARYHLNPLTRGETSDYIAHRMMVAGGSDRVFTGMAVRMIYHVSKGIPRLINLVADRSLLAAYASCNEKVSAVLSWRASRELIHFKLSNKHLLLWSVVVCIGLMMMGAIVANRLGYDWTAASRSVVSSLKSNVPVFSRFQRRHDEVVRPQTPVNSSVPSVDSLETAQEGPKEPLMPFSQRLSSLPSEEEMALKQLLGVWKISAPQGVEACNFAEKQGVACLAVSGTWAQLRAMNHPAVLEMNDRSNLRYLVLLELVGINAKVMAQGEIREYPLSEVLGSWTGRSTLFWRSGLGESYKPLIEGAHSPVIGWVRAKLEGHPLPDGDNTYDRELKNRIKTLQSERGMKADGVIGVQTMVLLESLGANPDVPVLVRNP